MFHPSKQRDAIQLNRVITSRLLMTQDKCNKKLQRRSCISVTFLWVVWQNEEIPYCYKLLFNAVMLTSTISEICSWATFFVEVCSFWNKPLKPRLHQDTCSQIQVVSTSLSPSTIYMYHVLATILSPVCCWIQRDTSRPFINMHELLRTSSAVFTWTEHADWNSIYPKLWSIKY